MTPSEIISGARSDGIVLRLAPNGRLTYRGSLQATEKWLPILQAAKTDIVAHLIWANPVNWDADDWCAFYDERAAILEYDGNLTRSDAEMQAWKCCVSVWMVQNPVKSAPGRCHACGGDGSKEPLLPYGTMRAGHVWLHGRCWPGWYDARKSDAAAALQSMGISGGVDGRRYEPVQLRGFDGIARARRRRDKVPTR